MAYVATTGTIAQWIERGFFFDGSAMTRYVVAFANAYRDALAHSAAGEHSLVPVAWQQHFDACAEGRYSVFQCLMLGINAHMTRDLPHTVIAAGVDVGSPRCYVDYAKIDDALRLNFPVVRRRIITAYASDMPLRQRWFGRLADAGLARGFERARRNSWRLAQLLASATSASARAKIERIIEERAAMAGLRILCSGNVWQGRDI